MKHIYYFFYILIITITATSAQASSHDDIFEEVILAKVQTHYTVSEKQNGLFEITAEGRDSASGLYISDPENIENFLPNYPEIEWSWRIDEFQKNADITIKGKDDYAASLQFVFQQKGLFARPIVLVYAWVGDTTPIGTVIKSPRAPNNFRTIIVGNKLSGTHKFLSYNRNIHEDYKNAYGQYPSTDLMSFGIFTDNDQTGDPVKAIYRLQKN